MSFDSQAPRQCHTIIETMHKSVLRSLDEAANIIPLSMHVEVDAGFKEIFPYGIQRHKSFEWMWLLDNRTHIRIDENIYRMSRGDFCLVAPGVTHAEMYSPKTPAHKSLWFSYSASTATIYANLFVYDSLGHGHIREFCAAQTPPLLGTILVALQNEINGEQDHAPDICRALLATLAHLIVRALETSQALENDAPEFVARRVVEYLRAHYAQAISIDDIARHVHLSRNYLSTIFKKQTGKTIGQTLTEIRLEHAKLLLMERRAPIREVAAAVGFAGPEHFCRVFQRHEKIAPSAYCR